MRYFELLEYKITNLSNITTGRYWINAQTHNIVKIDADKNEHHGSLIYTNIELFDLPDTKTVNIKNNNVYSALETVFNNGWVRVIVESDYALLLNSINQKDILTVARLVCKELPIHTILIDTDTFGYKFSLELSGNKMKHWLKTGQY